MTLGFLWLQSSKKCVIAIALASMCASLVYSFAYRIPPIVDARAYDAIAMNLVQGKGFREDVAKKIEYDPAIVRAGPGYEYVLASLYALFGHRIEVVWVLHALLHGASVLLLALICARVFENDGERISLIAAAIFGFSPDLLEISAMLMTETVYLFLLLATVFLFVEAFKRPRSARLAAWLGGSLGLAILFRPPVALFAIAILFFYAARRATAQLLCFLIVLCVVLTPWTIRNYRVYHEFIPTTLIGSYNLWLNNTTDAHGGQFNNETFNPLSDFAATHGYAAVKQKASQEFWAFVTQHPVSFVQLSALRAIRYMSLIRPMGFWFYQTGIGQAIFVALSGAWIALLFTTGFTGMLQALREKRPLQSYLIFLALTAPLVLIPTVVQSRYRFQIYPFLALFGAYFLARARTNWHLFKRPLLTTICILLSLTVVDAVLSSRTVFERVNSLLSNLPASYVSRRPIF